MLRIWALQCLVIDQNNSNTSQWAAKGLFICNAVSSINCDALKMSGILLPACLDLRLWGGSKLALWWWDDTCCIADTLAGLYDCIQLSLSIGAQITLDCETVSVTIIMRTADSCSEECRDNRRDLWAANCRQDAEQLCDSGADSLGYWIKCDLKWCRCYSVHCEVVHRVRFVFNANRLREHVRNHRAAGEEVWNSWLCCIRYFTHLICLNR